VNELKKILAVLLMALAVSVLFSGVAYANFGPHGGYQNDTDACAGCHRAHTSVSSVTWSDAFSNDHSALLVSNATKMSEFCYACHGDSAPGASTNVMSGVFDGGPSSPDGIVPPAGGFMYETNSSVDATLNGGGFVRLPVAGGFTLASSAHDMDSGTAETQWGAGFSLPTVAFTCTNCHDPHGSSNYRLLKDQLVGNDPSNAYANGPRAVGGYDGTDMPQPFIWSAEEGYPLPDADNPNGGWLKHSAGQTQMQAYRPNYTSPEYLWVGGSVGGTAKNISMWCSGCHTDYGDLSKAGNGSGDGSVADYGNYESAKNDAGATLGARARHRHPTNITLAAGVGPVGVRALAEEVKISDSLPLARFNKTRADHWDTNDYLDCLTCHRAHGVETTMTGWASASLVTSASAVTSWFPTPDPARGGGVNPSGFNTQNGLGKGTSSLLRLDNRGVCEVCHNK
jgi:hypothetical protein